MGIMTKHRTHSHPQPLRLIVIAAVVILLLLTAGILLQPREELPAEPVPPPEFHALDYGAVPNDDEDDTEAIQAAIDAAADRDGIVRIAAGTFLINTDPQTGSLHVKDGSTIQMDTQTILKSIPNNLPIYRIFTIYGKKNVSIDGGTLMGDRYDHKGTEGEFGHGILIGGDASKVIISNVMAKDFWGDGFIIEGDPKQHTYPTNITIHQAAAHNNRRQGLSITAGKDIVVKNSTFSKSNGTAPEAGIDLERDPPFNLPLENVSLVDNIAINNHGYGIAFVYANDNRAQNNVVKNNKEGGFYIGGNLEHGNTSHNELRDNMITGNGLGIFINFSTANTITGNMIEKSNEDGISLMNHVGQNELSRNVIRRNKGNGISIWGGLHDQSGIVVQSNEVEKNDQNGLSITDVSDASITHNQISRNKQAGLVLKSVQDSKVHSNTSKGNGDD